MENKTTTELLDLLLKLTDKDGRLKNGYEECLEEIKMREPFFTILNPDWEESLPALLERIKEIEDDIKKLKRHKHDKNNEDVLIRI